MPHSGISICHTFHYVSKKHIILVKNKLSPQRIIQHTLTEWKRLFERKKEERNEKKNCCAKKYGDEMAMAKKQHTSEVMRR